MTELYNSIDDYYVITNDKIISCHYVSADYSTTYRLTNEDYNLLTRNLINQGYRRKVIE